MENINLWANNNSYKIISIEETSGKDRFIYNIAGIQTIFELLVESKCSNYFLIKIIYGDRIVGNIDPKIHVYYKSPVEKNWFDAFE